jgi:hypothetical protein
MVRPQLAFNEDPLRWRTAMHGRATSKIHRAAPTGPSRHLSLHGFGGYRRTGNKRAGQVLRKNESQ